MSIGWMLLFALIGWVGLVGLAGLLWLAARPWLARGPKGDPVIGLVWRMVRLYCRVVHRARYHGLEELRHQLDPGPLIVVSNHTGAVDAMLIQAACRFQIRWMMAAEYMTPGLDWLWRQQDPIPVDRESREAAPAREAIRFVRGGGVVGLFPEGHIVKPPRQVRPFHPGVGLIVARTKARVLLAWVSGTPDATEMTKSLLTPSHARVEFIDLIDFKGEHHAQAITQQLRERVAAASGWPLNDELQAAPNSEHAVR